MKPAFTKILPGIILFLLTASANGNIPNIDSSGVENKSAIFSHRIILIGDAGEPSVNIKEPVLIALKEKAAELPESTLVVFLGDNIYPNGLPGTNHPDRKEYERRIDEQISAVEDAGAYGIFIPGNHDWKQGNDDGWKRILNQAEYVLNNVYKKVSFAPLNACPGPVVRDFGNTRLVILDTQWWLQDENNRPGEKDSICNHCSEDDVISALDSILKVSTGKSVIVAAHHPLKSYGPHGGHFTWKDHIFPLRAINENLWLPLPLIGSLYPIARASGASNQDLSNDEYRNLKQKLESVLNKYHGIIYASGHEHALQVINGTGNNIYVVSGAGIWGHVEESLTKGEDTIFAGQHEGFVILDYLSDGRMNLSVVKVLDKTGSSESVFSMGLR